MTSNIIRIVVNKYEMYDDVDGDGDDDDDDSDNILVRQTNTNKPI